MGFGSEVKKARIDKKWKQQDLQAATGITQKYLSEVELEKVDPSLSIVARIAAALGVSLDLLAREELENSAPSTPRRQTSKATAPTGQPTPSPVKSPARRTTGTSRGETAPPAPVKRPRGRTSASRG